MQCTFLSSLISLGEIVFPAVSPCKAHLATRYRPDELETMTSTKGCELAQRNPSQTGMTEAASKGDDSKKFSLLQSCALNTMVSRSSPARGSLALLCAGSHA